MLRVIRYLNKKDWGLVALALLFIVTQVWLDLKMPEYMSQITTLVQTQGSAMGDILTAGGYMLLCALGSLVSAFIVGFFAARVAAGLGRRLRGEVYDKTMSFSMEELGRFSIASLITRTTNDITQIQQTVAMGLQVMIKAPILAVWAVCKIAGKSWQWTAATGGAVAILIVLLTTIIIFAVPRFKTIQKCTDNLNRVTRENLTGLRVVRAYNAEDYQEEKFDKANAELTSTNLFVNRIMAVMQPGMSFIMSALSLAIYFIGALLINAATGANQTLLFSDMVVFSNYAVQIIMAFMMLIMIFIMLPRAAVSARRICEVLDTAPTIIDGAVTSSELYEQGEIEFKNVSFKYPDAADYVLKDISFTAHKGETIAFIGATASGKSTLVNLIPRFYDATEGEVIVDGVNVRDYTQQALRNKIGYVSQKAVMFSGSVSSNVSYGENGRAEKNDDDVARAVKVSQAAEFVDKLPGGYDAPVSQGGANLSGGQKQRLSIARAVCRNPEIYIFDDSFSALDYKTDKSLRQALKSETKNVTTLIIAQRIGTIKNADKIFVLDEGRIVGAGVHDELLKTCGVYKEIAMSQLSEEELKYA